MKGKMQFLHIFEGTERKVLVRLAALLLFGLALLQLAEVVRGGSIEERVPALPLLIQELGVAILVAAVVILMIEVGLRKEMLADIQEIVRKQQPSQYLASFRLRRTEYDERITADIRRAQSTEVISVIGISQRNMFDDHPGAHELEKKVREGIRFRFLLLHPSSTVVASIENLSKHYGFPDLRSSLLATSSGPVSQLLKRLENKRSYAGSLEIRLHRDLFSTLAYYSSPRLTVVGLYFAHTSGTLSPAFEVAPDEEMLPQAHSHFDALWRESQGQVLLRITARSTTNNIAKVFGLVSP